MIPEISLPDQTHRVTSLSILSEDTNASVINSLKRLTGKEWENKFSKYFLKGGSVAYRQLIYKQLVGKSLGIPNQRITWNYSSSKYSVRRRSASGGANQSNNIISPKGNEREEASSSQESNPQKEGSIATINQIINDLEKLKLSL